MVEGIKKVGEVMIKHSQCLPVLPADTVLKYLIKLSRAECEQLCESQGATQIQSLRHLMATTSDRRSVYKTMYSANDIFAFYFFQFVKKDCTLHHTIQPERILIGCAPSLMVYKYESVEYAPLNTIEASKCIYSFVCGIKKALDEFHRIGVLHNDIIPPNVCFNSDYEVVLIDIDRYYPIAEHHHMFQSSTGSSSCMYRLVDNKSLYTTGKQTDYL